MFCPKCGTQNPDGSKFCKGCGAPLGGQPAASHVGSPAPGAPGPTPTPGPAPAGASTAARKPRPKASAPMIAVVATIVATLVVGFATRWFGLAGSGLKPGTYCLNDSSGSTAMMLSVHGDGVVGVTVAGTGTFEGRCEATRSNGHLVLKLDDPNFAMSGTSANDVSDLSVSLILPSKLGKGSYAGDYAFRMSGTRGSQNLDQVIWLRFGDDGNVSAGEYSTGGSAGDPSAIFDSIASGSWFDDNAEQIGTWLASDGNAGVEAYDTSGNILMTETFEAYE
jgi:hypothetical protein